MSDDPQPAAWDSDHLADPHGQPDKAERVRRMFDAIAPAYERVNTLFSGGCDARWRRAAVKLAGVTASDSVIDIACGTGDFARAFSSAQPAPQRVVGCDFSHQMIRYAHQRPCPDRMSWCEADAQRLPFDDASFSIASCAFGVRNFQDLGAGLAEMHRVLAPGGRAVILEFTRPGNRLIRAAYEFYTARVMPWGAALISGDRTGAYRYLPRSVVSFLGATQMTARLQQAGFARVESHPLTFGAVTIHVAAR